jgi:hypothetical protein
MAIESISSKSGKREYRVSPKNPCVVQRKERGRWRLFKACQSHSEAARLVLELAKE